MKSYFMLYILSLVFLSCTVTSEPIKYGEENCSYCKMTIMDNKFGCELVTTKGKIFKFDDVACMISYLKNKRENSIMFSQILVNQYDKPGEMIDVEKVMFITSANFKSPMMGNTAAIFDENKIARILEKDFGAKKFDWNDLQKNIK